MNSKKFSLVINKPIDNFRKNITVDSDKSISIRSFLIGSICEGISSIKNVLESEDVFSTINCLRKLNIKILYLGNKTYKIFGRGLGSYTAKSSLKLNFGNSGTLARLITGIIASTPNINLKIFGDKSLNKRNMKNLIFLMNKFGAEFYPKNKYFFPLLMSSSNYPIGISYKSGTSAQLKSAVILAGLNSYGTTKIIENFKSRDHTENMLKENKQAIKIKGNNKKKINIFGKKSLKNFSLKVPGDPSSAAFFTALTLLKKNSYLKIMNVGLNPTRIGFYSLLKKSGAKIKFINKRKINNERVGDIIVKSSVLKPINASKKYYLNTTDEYPILFIISALIKGNSFFSGISDLKNKESDRIKEMQNILKQIGVFSIFKNGKLLIKGKNLDKRKIIKVKVLDLGDHRICMSAAILGLLTGFEVKIKNFETVGTSSPSFLKIIKQLGGSFAKKNK
tara:strand:+ start:1994 stop:3343 length:1350 start_codon:yes stop_codon:yes gene_type:complete